MAKNPNLRYYKPPVLIDEQTAPLKNNDIFNLARPLHCLLRGPMVGSPRHDQGVLEMFAIASRQAITAFAGAFVTALLFVSAATSLPIA
ncbi:hypothetical protein H9L13_01230 [Sphingomonas lutea]|uniref:Uncharacterized protein n=1 Tax=Sphingomonas lutea TaxID=1045317 RepID=A0A7G9SID7_9SPHN|nr:hypothetical protein [Sphingomonas lutea]QNN67612.1 hypothetical protein H9L13_01230 [Sphingomonas lutea]